MPSHLDLVQPNDCNGCKYLRICHLNNCATVATQRKDIIDNHFVGEKRRVNIFKFIADDVRIILVELGYKKLENIIGKTELLEDVSSEQF